MLALASPLTRLSQGRGKRSKSNTMKLRSNDRARIADPKFADPGAQIGVHKASDKGGRKTVLSGVATVSMSHFAKDLGVPSPIIARMMITPPTQIAWLSSRDLRSMGVMMAETSAQTRQVSRDGLSVQQTPGEFASLRP